MIAEKPNMAPSNQSTPLPVGLSESEKRKLAARLQKARNNAAAKKPNDQAIPRLGRHERIPLSFAQERLWFLDQLEPGSSAYNLAQAVRLSGPLDSPALVRSLNDLVARHDTLRSNFRSVAGVPEQVIAASRVLNLSTIDLSSSTDGSNRKALERILCDESNKPFDLSSELLLRAVLLRLSSDQQVLLLVTHHIISDGWSLGVLLRELGDLYASIRLESRPALPELPIQYGDFVLWEREQLNETLTGQHLQYWKKQLSGVIPPLHIPGARREPRAQASLSATHELQLSLALTDSLKSLSRDEGATLFMTLMTALQILLYRYTGQEDLMIGTCVAGRGRVELEGLIGLFVNTLVIRGDLRGDPAVSELIAKVRETILGAFAHQEMPFEKLVGELQPERILRRNPLFQIMFVFQNTPVLPARFGELESLPIEVPGGAAKFDLTLSMTDTPRVLLAILEYNTDIFEDAAIGRLLGQFATLLDAMSSRPRDCISMLPLLSPPEIKTLLCDWSGGGNAPVVDKNIPRLFEEIAAASPDSVALSSGSQDMTYGELNRRASFLAGYLRRAGVRTESLVGVCMERSIDLIVALLGILKAGGAYVSLDPAYPKERLKFMLEDTKAAVVLTQRKQRDGLSVVWDEARSAALLAHSMPPHLVCLDSEWRLIAREKAVFDPEPSTPDSLAYVSYTSGSTGKPKGVCVTHRGVARLVRGTNFARFDAREVFLQLSPVAFDASTLEIWGPLLNGGRLVIFPPGIPTVRELGDTIQNCGITTLWLTAGLFHEMVDQNLNALKGVRQLLAGGDVLSVPHVLTVVDKLPGTKLINGYGPTENTTFTCCWTINGSLPHSQTIPIGRPVSGSQVYILDARMNPVPVGVPGELFAAGDGLARCYLNSPELTAEKFVPHPFSVEPGARLYRTGDQARWLPDGAIEFLGRSDRQVKIRGFRLELAEIESVLASHPQVSEAAVAVREDKPGDKRLIAYVTGATQAGPPPAELRRHCLEKLPDYMVPTAFVFLHALPLNANGKVDRQALPAPGAATVSADRKFVAPRDRTEKELATIWESLLDARAVGIDDNFFELGGHSLLGVRLFARIEEQLGRKLPVASLFQAPTIRQLAGLIEEKGPSAACMSLVAIQAGGTKPPIFFVHGAGGGNLWGYTNLAPLLGSDQPVYGLESRGMRGLDEFDTIVEMASHYIEEIRTVQAAGPYYLGGYCFGGNVAHEIARQLCEQGEQVAFLGLLDSLSGNIASSRIRWWDPRFVFDFILNTGWWIVDFCELPPAERRNFVSRKLSAWGRRVRRCFSPRKPGQKEIDLDEIIEVGLFPEIELGLWRMHLKALDQHVPNPYPGKITLFKTRVQPFFCSFDPLCGWGDLAGKGVEVVDIPGSHEKIFLAPHLETVADKLRKSLIEVQSKTGV